MKLPPVNERELGTILVALRYLQSQFSPNERRNYFISMDATTYPITNAEIDDLCERLNLDSK